MLGFGCFGFYFYRRNGRHKVKGSQIHASSPEATSDGARYEPGFDDGGNMADPESRKMTAPRTPSGMLSPSISLHETTRTSTGNKLQSTVTTTHAMGGSTVNNAAGGGGTKQSIGSSTATVTFHVGPDGSTPTPTSTKSSLVSIDWSNLALAAKIGSGSFSAVCKYSCLNLNPTLPKF